MWGGCSLQRPPTGKVVRSRVAASTGGQAWQQWAWLPARLTSGRELRPLSPTGPQRGWACGQETSSPSVPSDRRGLRGLLEAGLPPSPQLELVCTLCSPHWGSLDKVVCEKNSAARNKTSEQKGRLAWPASQRPLLTQEEAQDGHADNGSRWESLGPGTAARVHLPPEREARKGGRSSAQQRQAAHGHPSDVEMARPGWAQGGGRRPTGSGCREKGPGVIGRRGPNPSCALNLGKELSSGTIPLWGSVFSSKGCGH